MKMECKFELLILKKQSVKIIDADQIRRNRYRDYRRPTPA